MRYEKIILGRIRCEKALQVERACAYIFLGKVKTLLNGLMQIVAKSVNGLGDWSGYPLDCYDSRAPAVLIISKS